MPSAAFTLTVPTDRAFRGLVADAVRTYLRASGNDGSATTEAFVEGVSGAVDALADAGDVVELEVLRQSADVTVELRCGAERRSLTHAVERRA